jgi:excisionase family DNA binding protein
VREIGLELLDALERLEAVDRKFQRRSRRLSRPNRTGPESTTNRANGTKREAHLSSGTAVTALERDGNSLPAPEISSVMHEDRLLRASEVQKELGVSRATAYRMMTDGTLPAYRFGGRNGRRAMIRVSRQELWQWIAAHKSTLAADPTEQPTC